MGERERRVVELSYDEATVAQILAALLTCPASQRMDSMAAAIKVFVEGRLDEEYNRGLEDGGA